MAAPRKKKETQEIPLAPIPQSKPRKRFYMQKMPDGVGERAVRIDSFRSGARAQTMADFFGSSNVQRPDRNQRSMESLLGELLSEWNLEEDTMAPELLAEAWVKAVGPALADVSSLSGVARGYARISVKHPAVRYEITRLKTQIIRALNRTLGQGCVKQLQLVSV